MALTDKQRVFCDEYMIDKNATRAAIAAGYSPKTAYSIGSENLNKPEIKEYLGSGVAIATAAPTDITITRERILAEIAKLAFAEGSDMNGAELRNSNKIKALEMLARYAGILTEKPPAENDTETGVVLLPPILDRGEPNG